LNTINYYRLFKIIKILYVYSYYLGENEDNNFIINLNELEKYIQSNNINLNELEKYIQSNNINLLNKYLHSVTPLFFKI